MKAYCQKKAIYLFKRVGGDEMLKKTYTKIMAAALATAAVSGIVLIASALKSTPEKTLMKYAEALEKGDRKKIVKLYTPESQMFYEGLSIFMDDMFDYPMNVKARIVVDEVVYDDGKGSAEVSYYIITESKDGGEVDVDYASTSMVKSKGKWYIDEGF